MVKKLIVLFAVVLVALSANTARAQDGATASFELKDAAGQSVGTVTLAQTAGGVNVKGSFRNLPQGVHGIHFHTVGTCTPNFDAAGGHYNPAGKQHGLENPSGAHGGDLANLTIAADGTGSYDFTTTLVTLSQGATTLYDADGTSLMIHANADDYKTDPSGNSGGRIACGVVTAAAVPAVTAPSAAPAPAEPEPATLPDTGSGATEYALLLGLAIMAIGAGAFAVRRGKAQR